MHAKSDLQGEKRKEIAQTIEITKTWPEHSFQDI